MIKQLTGINYKKQIRREIFNLSILAVFVVILVTMTGCAKSVPYVRKAPVPSAPLRYQEGWASWYGPKFHGRRTSSGEVFNMYNLTAAHRTLPLGTQAIVTRLDNGRSVNVRINDRGPFIKGRIVDLSYAAARILHMENDGVARVRLEVIGRRGYSSASYSNEKYTIQVGSFIYRRNAVNLKSELERKFRDVYIHQYNTTTDRYYRVRVGTFNSKEAAMGTAQKLASEGQRVYISPVD